MTDSKAAVAMFRAAAGEAMGPVVHRQLQPFSLLAREILTSLPDDVRLVVGRQTSHSWYVGNRWADALTHDFTAPPISWTRGPGRGCIRAVGLPDDKVTNRLLRHQSDALAS
jgi:hypothetical protein